MHHSVRRTVGNGWQCGACTFHALADDLKAVAAHVTQSQEVFRIGNEILDYGYFSRLYPDFDLDYADAY